MALLARRELKRGRMIRIDRHDVMSDVPAEAGIEEQLAWCRSHLLRVNAAEEPAALHTGRAAESERNRYCAARFRAEFWAGVVSGGTLRQSGRFPLNPK